MISNSIQKTKDIAKKFAATLQGGDVVLLSGELGAGKTAFTKGLAEYFSIEQNITSPTFSLMNVYPIVIPNERGDISHSTVIPSEPRGDEGSPSGDNWDRDSSSAFGLARNDKVAKFIHIDTYRLKNAQELIDIGVEDYLGTPNTICIIEWPKKISELLQNKKTIAVAIEHIDERKRSIAIAK
ncbi:MAG: tRNA (adenosine(37)-N6)-threonylcarbamoyltransferase complex ATPase subunit type 1 TsaE [Candidatus Magasanikbacteria bacterium RIFOXYC2_FULL_42_28]|uniref:tRNA threonylcarbamoyladenosine biosynthesis protein TsaE n=1 Tax=Candidatus Magasanikbacteria bacterium RIFOXYC2_FULL_42_28 TaxID=1798704 RepID=A0A1F6NWA4_9BACT|nr:MAG: tRNA (adenosine(37)-N6)-threonylcarbamoyltransferase complex ATPase subunit type 1 TsaE [Candidatus Magasanikbacteria bacterium RIFOXYC2_FULL_42_28]